MWNVSYLIRTDNLSENGKYYGKVNIDSLCKLDK